MFLMHIISQTNHKTIKTILSENISSISHPIILVQTISTFSPPLPDPKALVLLVSLCLAALLPILDFPGRLGAALGGLSAAVLGAASSGASKTVLAAKDGRDGRRGGLGDGEVALSFC